MWWCSSSVTIRVCMLGHRHCSRVLGPHCCLCMLVLGPHPFVVCHVHFAFIGHWWPCGWSSLVAGVFTLPLSSSGCCVMSYHCLHMLWVVLGCCCCLWGGVGGPLWPFMGAGGHGGPSLSLVVVMGCCVGVLSAHHVCWLCCGSMLLLGRGCAVSLLSGCGHCAMLLLAGCGCHVSLSCGVNKRKEGGGCPDSPDVDGDDVVHLHRRCQEGEGQRVVMGREEEVWEKIG